MPSINATLTFFVLQSTICTFLFLNFSHKPQYLIRSEQDLMWNWIVEQPLPQKVLISLIITFTFWRLIQHLFVSVPQWRFSVVVTYRHGLYRFFVKWKVSLSNTHTHDGKTAFICYHLICLIRPKTTSRYSDVVK